MPDSLPFDFEIPLNFFEKSDEEAGKQRRIGGLASVETRDRQNELLVQKGLDFGYFLSNGWFNDNHSKATADILGYPDKMKYYQKGQKLPNGEISPGHGHWVEGYLLDTDKADEVWNLGKALQKTKRRLGLSVEGSVLKRTGDQGRDVAKAIVRNVAITNCPVNTDARMDILVKSLNAVQNSSDPIDKALSVGTVAEPGVTPTGPQTGTGAGQVLARESLECDEKDTELQVDIKSCEKKKKTKKSMTNGEAQEWLRVRLPNATPGHIERIVTLSREWKRRGEL